MRLIFILLLALPLMARSDQCGYGWPGCNGSFHDCTLKSGHSGSHRCGNCGARK